MGYYKQLEVSQQDDVDRTIAWYKASGQYLPKYLHNWLLLRDERLWGAIQAWEKQPVEPKPAADHVALQAPQITRKQALWLERNKTVVSLTNRDYNTILGVLVGTVAVIVAIAVTGLVL